MATRELKEITDWKLEMYWQKKEENQLSNCTIGIIEEIVSEENIDNQAFKTKSNWLVLRNNKKYSQHETNIITCLF